MQLLGYRYMFQGSYEEAASKVNAWSLHLSPAVRGLIDMGPNLQNIL